MVAAEMANKRTRMGRRPPERSMVHWTIVTDTTDPIYAILTAFEF